MFGFLFSRFIGQRGPNISCKKSKHCLTLGVLSALVMSDNFQAESQQHPATERPHRSRDVQELPARRGRPGMNCIKIGLPGKLILSKRKGLREVLFCWKYSLRIDFPGRPIFIQLPPDPATYPGSSKSPMDAFPRSSAGKLACSSE